MNVSWNKPMTTNGVIIVYEISYNPEYRAVNTTDTYTNITGLVPYTSYLIRIRAYTSVGPGTWRATVHTTNDIRKL